MGKLVGGACVFIGFVILLACWMERMKRNIRNMLAIVRFLQSWAYVLEVRQMRVAEFLETYPYDVPELEHVADEVQHDLLLHLYPTGQEVWQKVLKRQKHTLGLPEDAFQVLLRAGEGFFGNNHIQNRCSRNRCNRAESGAETQRQRGAGVLTQPCGSDHCAVLDRSLYQ